MRGNVLRGFHFPANSVFLPLADLLAHYTTCLPFEERLSYLLMVRVFTESDGNVCVCVCVEALS